MLMMCASANSGTISRSSCSSIECFKDVRSISYSSIEIITQIFSSLSKRQACTWVRKISEGRSLQRQKKISLKIVPTAPTLSTRFISAATNSQPAILSACLSEVFSNRLTISPPKTMLYFAPNNVSFTLKRRFIFPSNVTTLLFSFRQESNPSCRFFVSKEKKYLSHRTDYILFVYICTQIDI